MRSRSMLLSLATLALLPSAATAQTLQLYGVADGAVTLQTKRATAAATSGSTTVVPSGTGTVLAVSSGAWQSSRIGVRGKVEVREGVSAVYDLATTVNLSTSSVLSSNRLFDRNALVGLASPRYGTLTFGRQGTTVAEAVWATDPLRVGNTATNMNARLGYLAGAGAPLQNAFGPNPQNNGNGSSLDRQDSSLKYAFAAKGLVATAMYSFGGVGGEKDRNSSAGLLAGYEAGPVKLRLAGTRYTDGAGEKLFAVTSGAVVTVQKLSLRATYSASKVADRETYGDLRTDVWAVGATYSLLPELDLTAAYYGARRTQVGSPAQHATKLYLVPEYLVSKQLKIYTVVDYELFDRTGAALDTGTPLEPGTRSSLHLALGLSYAFGS